MTSIYFNRTLHTYGCYNEHCLKFPDVVLLCIYVYWFVLYVYIVFVLSRFV